VVENLKVFAKIYGVARPAEKIDELLEMFEIAHLKFKTSGMLSSGEQTRLNLCKALLNDPALLVLDEPTASLDPDLADKVRKILKRVKEEKGMTVLTTSHNMLDVVELCDRIIFMHLGAIVAEGSSEEIMTRFGTDSLEDVFIRIARTKEKVIA
jgi:ABC-2 type transport system ATP-binding protein